MTLSHRSGTIPMSTFDLADLCNLLRILDFSYDTDSVAYHLQIALFSELSSRTGKTISSYSDILPILHNSRGAGRKPKFDPIIDDQIRMLRKSGLSLKRIADSMGLSYSKVQRTLAVK